MRRARAAILFLLLWRGPTAAAPGGGVEEVRRVLDQQVAAWNRRDLEGYMAGYWRSPELTFFGGSTVTRGWQATLDRYRARYQAEGREMGTLEFSELVVERLGESAAVARGRWHLALSAGKESQGLFTVLLRRLPEGWRIIHDHSS